MADKSVKKPWTENLVKSPTQEKINLGLLILTLISLLLSVYATIDPGSVGPIPPSGYAIIRGDGGFPSDLLVLPIDWENTSGRTALIRHPTLILHELDKENRETGTRILYTLAGEYPEITHSALQSRYEYKYSIVLAPHSINTHVLAFHIRDWWDDRPENMMYGFQFKGATNYRVTIVYQVNDGSDREQDLFELPIYPSADLIKPDRTGSYWDYFYLE